MESYLAPKWGALVVMAEARYYGASLPFGNASFTPENVEWLTTALILADARLLAWGTDAKLRVWQQRRGMRASQSINALTHARRTTRPSCA